MAARWENHLCGMLVINKEPGFTSSDVVAKLRGILHMRRIGHTGTLDPMAEGVLPICLGSATKAAELIADRDKEYVARLRLGVTTDTQDMTGTVLTQLNEEELLQRLGVPAAGQTDDWEETAEGDTAKAVTSDAAQNPNEALLRAKSRICEAASQFVGEIQQIPPMYSAVWSDGKRLYELAREGKTVERKPRTITIYELEIQDISLPFVTMRIVCSKGTYIRTLCEDLGHRLGVGGAMEHLLRTRVGSFSLDRSLRLSELEEKVRTDGFSFVREQIIPVDSFFMDAPAVHVTEEAMKYLRNGNALSGDNLEERILPAKERIRVYDERGEFYALYHYDRERRRILPTKMFHDTDSREHDSK